MKYKNNSAKIALICLIGYSILVFINAFARNFDIDNSLPLPNIIKNENTLKSSNCQIAVQSELELFSFNGFPNGSSFERNGIPSKKDIAEGNVLKYDSDTFVLKDNKSIYNVFCTKFVAPNAYYSKNYIEYNTITGEQKTKELDVFKKLFLKNY